ncbi:hypothetical protein NQD34_005715, partial [Periophthalmus magnuspinnatus]
CLASSSAHFSPKGLFCLSVSGRAYRLIEDQLSWTEAQSYCRAQYLDLATVDDQEQLNLLINVTQRNPPLGHVWTGLYDDMDSWRWSLQKEGYYDGGLDQFRLWDVGFPTNYKNVFRCGVTLNNGKWKNDHCDSTRPFICYSESASPKFKYYRTLLTWRDAQSYCRQHHTDLVSIRNQVENDQVFALMSGPSVYTHIGLYRDGWKWSDGSPVSFTKFNDRTGVPCVALFGTGMETKDCATPCPFVCNGE